MTKKETGTNYKVRKGFMAFQFNNGKPTYSIGIEKTALEKAKIYNCIVGKEQAKVTVTLDDIDRLIKKYGLHRIIRKRRNKKIYVVPLKEVGYKKPSKKKGVQVPVGQKKLLD